MNKLEREEKTESSMTVRELIAGSETVLDHWFLRRIVETAPSPIAADNYVCKVLGCMSGDGQAVRKAVRLKEKYKDKKGEWEAINSPTFRLAEMFKFLDANFLSAKAKIMLAESLDYVTLQRPYKNWPWLLKEMAVEDKGKVITTFDFLGIALPEKIKSLAEARNPNFYTLRKSSCDEEYDLGKYGQMTIFNRGGSRIIKNRLTIYSRSCELEPGYDRIFPQFYKVMEISQPLIGSTERILIFIRQEMAKGLRETFSCLPEANLGEIIYERDIPVSLKSERVVARLSVSYKINFDLTCEQIPAQFRPSPIAIHYCYPRPCQGNNDWARVDDMSHLDFDPEKISAAMRELSELASIFFGPGRENPFPLSTVISDKLLLSSPESLANQFIA